MVLPYTGCHVNITHCYSNHADHAFSRRINAYRSRQLLSVAGSSYADVDVDNRHVEEKTKTRTESCQREQGRTIRSSMSRISSGDFRSLGERQFPVCRVLAARQLHAPSATPSANAAESSSVRRVINPASQRYPCLSQRREIDVWSSKLETRSSEEEEEEECTLASLNLDAGSLKSTHSTFDKRTDCCCYDIAGVLTLCHHTTYTCDRVESGPLVGPARKTVPRRARALSSAHVAPI